MDFRLLLYVAVALAVVMPAKAASVNVDCASKGQKWEGWGATELCGFDSFEHEPEAGAPGKIPTDGRKEILRLYYEKLGMNFVRFSPSSYEPRNDNADPRVIDPAGFDWKCRGARPHQGVDSQCDDHLVMGREFRSKVEPFIFYPAANCWENWMSMTPDAKRWWFGKDGRFNPAMVEEYAEHALAAVLHIKQVYGYELPYWSLFNEPFNTAKPTRETMLALVLACGRRFAENHVKTKIVICDDVTPEASAESIEYVLANEKARRYVGAVSYHRYCGDFVLETVKPMLRKVDKGERLVSAPVSFYESAAKYGKSVWLSEQCSYGDSGITSFDAGRARANHICDEINFGKVNSFNFMLCYFIERGRPGNEECPIYVRFAGGRYSGAEINSFGWWISQFTRCIRPGAVRLDVSTDNRLVNTVAFSDAASKTVVVVLINNHPDQVNVDVRLDGSGNGVRKAGVVRTEPGAEHRILPELALRDGHLTDALPGTSITTYVVAQTR